MSTNLPNTPLAHF